jgi:hypothetical protein
LNGLCLKNEKSEKVEYDTLKFTFVPYLMNDALVVLYCYYHNHFQMIHLIIQVIDLDKKNNLFKIMKNFSFILSFEFNDCSEETRPIGRRILFGLTGPLGGCGVLLFINSFDGVSGVSQSETKEKYLNQFYFY